MANSVSGASSNVNCILLSHCRGPVLLRRVAVPVHVRVLPGDRVGALRGPLRDRPQDLALVSPSTFVACLAADVCNVEILN